MTHIKVTTAGQVHKGDTILLNGEHAQVTNLWRSLGGTVSIEVVTNGKHTSLTRPVDGLIHRIIA